MKKLAKTLFFVVFVVVFFLIFLTIYYFYTIPNEYKTFSKQKPQINAFGVELNKVESADFSLIKNPKKFVENEYYEAKLFNLIPIKNVVVKRYKNKYIIPCGTPFGVKFLTDGVMVVDTQEISTSQGQKNPSKEAGIKKGDIIEFVNEEKVSSNSDLKDIVLNGKGEEIKLKYNRNFKQYETFLTPVFSPKENKWFTGLWVRDSSAGIGTTTFCTEDGIFGGLGHPVCDVDTGEKLPLGKGEIVKASISSIKKGICGSPGELCGRFVNKNAIGNATINNESGLYGKLYKKISPHKPVMIGFKNEVKPGKAKIFCTVEGENSKEYSILIESINKKAGSRNFVVKITDENLLKKTGGIVQGMSGSPIIQNGKFVGAITHVFLNDSTRGYGIFAETMLEVSDEVLNTF